MAVALYMPTLNLAMRVTATMADGASPAHTVRVIMAFSKQPLLGGDE